jgi:hypothetical protein
MELQELQEYRSSDNSSASCHPLTTKLSSELLQLLRLPIISMNNDDMPLSIVDDERNGVESGEAAHDKQGAGVTTEGKGACFLGWQRAGT